MHAQTNENQQQEKIAEKARPHVSVFDEAKRQPKIPNKKLPHSNQSNLQRTEIKQTISNQAAQPLIQAKLKIGQPNDRYEQEADRVADKVMRMPKPKEVKSDLHWHGVRPFYAQQYCATCGKELQRQSSIEVAKGNHIPAKGIPASTLSSAAVTLMHGQGYPLPQSVREDFEPKLGARFNHVRIHTDSGTADTAAALNARAFTIGNDIGFGMNEYSPRTKHGKQLLAHELVHVMQQRKNVVQRLCRGTDRSTSPMEWAIQNAYLQENDNAEREVSFGNWRGHVRYADIVDYSPPPTITDAEGIIYEIKENSASQITAGQSALTHYIGAAFGNCGIRLVKGRQYTRRQFRFAPDMVLTAELGPPPGGLILWQFNRQRPSEQVCGENFLRASSPIEILIQEDYKLRHPQGMREYAIPNAGPQSNTGFADLVDLDGHKIYEIKPANNPREITNGQGALRRYRANASQCDQAASWQLGTDYGIREFDPRGSSPGASRSSLYLSERRIVAFQDTSLYPGLILYREEFYDELDCNASESRWEEFVTNVTESALRQFIEPFLSNLETQISSAIRRMSLSESISRVRAQYTNQLDPLTRFAFNVLMQHLAVQASQSEQQMQQHAENFKNILIQILNERLSQYILQLAQEICQESPRHRVRSQDLLDRLRSQLPLDAISNIAEVVRQFLEEYVSETLGRRIAEILARAMQDVAALIVVLVILGAAVLAYVLVEVIALELASLPAILRESLLRILRPTPRPPVIPPARPPTPPIRPTTPTPRPPVTPPPRPPTRPPPIQPGAGL